MSDTVTRAPIPFAMIPNWLHLHVRPTAVVVYMVLAVRADSHARQCWPSIDTLTEEAGLSKPTLLQALNELEEVGAIVRHQRKPRSTLYTLPWVGPPFNGKESSPFRNPVNGQEPLPSNGQRTLPRTRTRELEPVGPPVVPHDATTTFDDFWAGYPRKIAKKAARKAWDSAIADTDPDVIVAALTANPPSAKEVRHIPYASTWLNGERWNDEPDVVGDSSAPARRARLELLDDQWQQMTGGA